MIKFKVKYVVLSLLKLVIIKICQLKFVHFNILNFSNFFNHKTRLYWAETYFIKAKIYDIHPEIGGFFYWNRLGEPLVADVTDQNPRWFGEVAGLVHNVHVQRAHGLPEHVVVEHEAVFSLTKVQFSLFKIQINWKLNANF